MTELSPLYDIDRAAELLAVPRSWLRDKVTEKAVPFTRLGRHVRFTEAHLAQIVAAGENQPASRHAPAPTPLSTRRRRNI